jgi:hypothetical protein
MNTDLESIQPSPEPNKRRNGKVARLPKDVRDRINQLLLDGVTYLGTIQTLGDVGKDLNEDNLANWKAGGYQDWLRQQQRVQEHQAKFELALDLVRQKPNATIQEAGRQIASAQLCELLLNYDSDSMAVALQEKPELYPRLISVLARISEGETACSHSRAQEELIRARLDNAKPNAAPGVVREETLRDISKDLQLL